MSKHSYLNNVFLRLSMGFLLYSSVVSASQDDEKVYKTVDKDGKVTFTDAPGEKPAKEVDLKPINTQPAVEKKYRQPKADPSVNIPNRIFMVSPSPGAKIGPAQKQLSLSVKTSKKLKSAEKIQFYFDGKVHGSASKKTSVLVSKLRRGPHSASAAILDSNGSIIAQSETVSFYAIRPTSKAY